MVYVDLSTLFNALVLSSKLTGDAIQTCKDRILAAEQMFYNDGPVHEDWATAAAVITTYLTQILGDNCITTA